MFVGTPSARTRSARRAALLTGACVAALFMAAADVHAKPLGTFAPSPSAAAIAAAQSGSQEAAQAARDAQNALKRATLAIQAMQSVQSAAREAAKAQLNTMPNMVPNGLQVGGLQIGSGVKLPNGNVDSSLWQGANLPTEFADGDRSKVTVDQTQQKAILTWDTFHVGGKTDLTFDQKGNASWVALNRVLGTDARPSQILGSIKADGQVYIINQNGIVFGGASQVNVGALIASSAQITNDQFLNNGIYSQQSGGNYLPSFTGAGGKVVVESGALITTNAPASVTSGGGFALLMGSAVENAGSISTPRGQTILAAGDDFILRRGYGTEANQASTTRGNEISPIIRTGSPSGSVTNNGLVFSQQGDITLAGRSIAQNGVLISTTSVNTRGTIHLLNSASDSLGNVTLGASSLTDILPELDSDETALNSQRDALIAASSAAAHQPGLIPQFDNLSLLGDRLDQSRIEIVTGGNAVFKGGSLTIAQGGQVAVSAGKRIFTEDGTTIDVSGVRDVALAMSSNNLKVNIQGNELRDSPQNRDGSYLKNANVWIDIRDLILVPKGAGGYDSDRYYTPGGLLEVGGYLANTAHKIGEWSALGGTIMLSAPEVIAQQGSVFDISGGSVSYAAGNIVTTNFLGADGRTYNINDARGDMTFYGLGQGWIRKNARWGVTEVYIGALGRGRETVRWEEGYTVGRDAGRLILSTPTAIFEGQILADIVTGERQQNARPSSATDGYKLTQNTAALAGTFALGRYTSFGLVGAQPTDVEFGNIASITKKLDVTEALPADRTNTAWFDIGLINDTRLGGLNIASSQRIAVDAPLMLANGGQLTFAAPVIDVKADITAHGGSVTLGNVMSGMLGLGQAVQWWSLLAAGGTSQVTIASGNKIDLSGLWTNGLLDPSNMAGLAYLNGGNLTVSTTGGITLAGGSLVDVSSGGAILPNGKTNSGKGGDVSLLTNNYAHLSDGAFYQSDRSAPLLVDGAIRAYGFNGGGTLTLNAPQTVVIGDSGAATGPVLSLGTDLFQSGFTRYDITGSNGIKISEGVTVAPSVPVYRSASSSFVTPTGSAFAGELWLPPAYLENSLTGTLTQRIGADLVLVTTRGDFSLANNAAIAVDPGRAVNIYANGQATIDGHISAPSGAILIGGAQESVGQLRMLGGNGSFSLTRSIWIGESAVLDVAGRAVVASDVHGLSYGVVNDGGKIELGGADGAGSDAFVVIRPGAILDASGTSAVLDLLTNTPGGTISKSTSVASSGGMIAVNSNSGIYIDGDLRAAAGGIGASGGTLSLNLIDRFYSPTPPGVNSPDGIGVIPDQLQKLRNITLVQHREASGLAGGLAPGEADAALQFGRAVLSVDQIQQGGFGSLALRASDLFIFKGDINLSMSRSLTLSGGILSVADETPGINVTLAAPYIRLNGWVEQMAAQDYHPGLNNVRPSQRESDSKLTFSADLLDISGDIYFGISGFQGSGNLSYIDPTNYVSAPLNRVDVLGFSGVTFRSTGDLRFATSTVNAPGDIFIEAAQIYPLSGASALIKAGWAMGSTGVPTIDPDTSIIIRSSGGAAPAMPASAFGNIAFLAPTIDQGGIVRAPLGVISFNKGIDRPLGVPANNTVIFRDGSITSASAAGLVMPFGGTSDGIAYQGADGTFVDLGSSSVGTDGTYHIVTGISIAANSIVGEPGAVLDLSGGGNLTGAGFVSGRGGSVDVLKTVLVNANPANSYSVAGNKVYAIMPGYASAYAPVIATNGAGAPSIGQQITIQAGVPGLPAGTYTLLPSSYALLPGAFRIELGATGAVTTPSIGLPNGSYIASGTLGIANTGIHNALATQLILTSGQTVRTYSQYNEMSYSDFARSQAAVFGNVRPRLPVDGKLLEINLGMSSGQSLSFSGTAHFNGVGDGISGSLVIDTTMPQGIIDITAPGATPIAGHTSISTDDIASFNAPTLFIGGSYTYQKDTTTGTGSRIYLSGVSTVNVLDGAVLRAGQVFLIGNSVNVEGGATIDTRGLDNKGLDSTIGYMFGNVISETSGYPGPAVLAVANGWLNFLPVVGSATIDVASGATLLTEGSIVLAAPGSLTMGDVNFGARYLTVAQEQINTGTAGALAAAQSAGVLPAGWNLSQATLDKLLRPSTTVGAPALERLTLTAGGAINFFGTVSLDARGHSAGGHDVQFVLNTPAIYGSGTIGDSASILADSFVWNGVRVGNGATGFGGIPYGSKAPAAIISGGAGTGAGRLSIDAKDITLGYDSDSRPTDGTTLDRLVVGFSDVNLNATGRITGNSDGTLSVGQARDSSGALQGGNLTLTTPLITGENGSTIDYKAGGAIRITAPVGAALPDTSKIANLGGTVSFSGDSVFLDTSVALPSGKLTLNATGNIDLGSNAVVDLAGRSIAFFDVTKYSWGGDLVLTSAHGDIVQSAGSVIDVSARNNDAGSVAATADDIAHGRVSLDGTLKGAATGGYQAARIALRMQSLGDFAAFNVKLNQSGFFGARSFDLKRGDLVVGNEVKANSVSILVDGGSLTVNGTIDASGAKPGTIRLAARNNLILSSTANLDTHSTQLQVDSYGAPVEADNTARVDLTTSHGTIVLAQGASIDMRSADGVARGKLSLNAPRLGATDGRGTGANDIAIDASHSVAIAGAASIAVNGFWTYTDAPVDPADANGQVIDQAYLNGIHAISAAFIDAAGVNADLQGRLAGLKAFGSAFHLRPGVEIDSATPNGNLSTSGDIDLSGYRYGPHVDPAVRGSGEAGVIVLRAGGSLKINGSLNDGFAPPPDSPDALKVLVSGTLETSYTIVDTGATLAAGAVLPNSTRINIPLPIAADTSITTSPTVANPIPVDIVLADEFQPPAANRRVTGTIYNPDGTVMYSSGQVISRDVIWPVGTRIAAGTYFNQPLVNAFNPLVIQALVLPANTNRQIFDDYIFNESMTLPVGTVLPAGMSSVSLTAAGDRKVWAISPMLAPGTQSWSMRLVGGADLGSADSRSLQSVTNLAADTGNVVLNDPFGVNLVGTGVSSAGVSVVRTGTGDLEILAGRDYRQGSPFGVYTAGTAIAGTGTPANDPYNVERGIMPDGSVLGAANSAYEATLNPQRMYYTERGGDFLLVAQGDIGGSLKTNDSSVIGNWLWRQGGAGIGQATAWGINFGSYTAEVGFGGPYVNLDTFSGMGALGGGKVTLNAGRDIGNAGQGIVVAVGGSGRVMADGSLVQTGGGTLSVTAGRNVGGGGNQFVDLRGEINVAAGSFGSLTSTSFGYNGLTDPRPLDPLTPYGMTAVVGGSFAPGDGAVIVRTRGDLAMGSIDDPGRVGLGQQTNASTSAGLGQGATWFTLWTGKTAIDMFAAGGDLAPLSSYQGYSGPETTQSSTAFLPAIMRGVAANGSIFLTPNSTLSGMNFMLPSPGGELELLAQGSVIQQNTTASAFGPLSASMSSLATPFNPGWVLQQVSGFSFTIVDSNVWGDPMGLPDRLGNPRAYSYDSDFSGYNPSYGHQGNGGTPFVFGPNTITDKSAASNGAMSRIYAVNGDITQLQYGETYLSNQDVGGVLVNTNYYRAAKPVQMLAGGDIINPSGLILQNNPGDVSMIAAVGSVVNAQFDVAGPGTLEVTAGKNIYQGSTGTLHSIGPLVTSDTRPGASIVLQAGVGNGAAGVGQVDWTGFADVYLNPSNAADPSKPLADQPGKVAKTYDEELYVWLKDQFGYGGAKTGALAYFIALPAPQQRIFLRQVYYAELTAGGREYNDASSSRYGSYLRGRNAIAALFPVEGAYAGDISIFSMASGTPGNANYKVTSGYVHTDFGGDVQLLAPGGQIVLGTEGLAPGADAGLITQGTGNIQAYSRGSILLGLSRVMTTFGGNIVMWSAEGDINAGRGSKTTVLFTPPKRTYDIYGTITLAPQVPSSGAGIATLNPIPEVTAGNIDLIAPLGTIDAGEAGIRSSGNVNLAALQIVNAANIQAQGNTTGVPQVQAPNIGGLTQASNTAGAAAQQATTPGQGSGNAQPSIIIVEVLGFGGGGGEAPDSGEEQKLPRTQEQRTYNTHSAFQIVGVGALSEDQNQQLAESERRNLAGR